MKGKQPQRGFIPKSRKLTVLEEEKLVEYILDLDARAFPPRVCMVGDMANIILKERGIPSLLVGTNWASKFIQRHAELCT